MEPSIFKNGFLKLLYFFLILPAFAQVDTTHGKIQERAIQEALELSRNETGRGPLIEDMLLPKNIIPSHYDLGMKVYLPGYGSEIPTDKNLTFTGKVTIMLKAGETVNKITLNSKSLVIEKSTLMTEKGPVEIIKVNQNTYLEKVEFVLKSPVKGNFNLTIDYSGPISDGLNGFYQTRYTSNGRTRIAALTKMEASYARKMVPCFDEPEYKATWNVTILHPKGTSAISNGIEIGEPQEIDDFLLTKFKTTPPMSTYLLALMVSEFTFIEGRTTTGVRFRIWTRPEAKNTATLALTAGIKCLEGFEKFFGIPFPLEKQDMVAVPDFASGAMENWGLITYRETALLYDQQNYYYPNKQRVVQVIAHELAHQWFGNLVTMKWWDDIWLNEGFAAFTQNTGIDMITDGAFQMENDFVMDQQRQTLELDATAASHPIIYRTTRQEEISDLFDVISYRKGASLLSMIRKILGEGIFNKGVHNYLKKYAYKNAEHRDLFNEWDLVVPESLEGPRGRRLNVTEFALRWTHQMGYPYLTLERLNSTMARVVQRRYKVDPAATERQKFARNPYGYKWDVPVWIQRGANIELKWLPFDGDLLIPAGEDEAVVLNADSYAIARMNYDEKGWRNIFRELEKDPEVYSVRTKYRIVADVFAMAAIGKVKYSLALDVVNYLKKETSHIPWAAFFYNKDELSSCIGNFPEKRDMEKFMKNILGEAFKSIDIRNVTNTMVDEKSYMKNRLKVTQWAEHCIVDNEASKEILKEFSEELLLKPCEKGGISSECSRVPVAIRKRVYIAAVKDGDEQVFQKMLEMYEKETLQLERQRILQAMSESKEQNKLKWLLSHLIDLNSTLIRVQDCGTLGGYLEGNKVAAEFLLDYLIEHWDKIYKKFHDSPNIMNKLITSFTSQIRLNSDLEKLKHFVAQNPNTGRFFRFTQQIQAAEKRIQWLKKNLKSVTEAFRGFSI